MISSLVRSGAPGTMRLLFAARRGASGRSALAVAASSSGVGAVGTAMTMTAASMPKKFYGTTPALQQAESPPDFGKYYPDQTFEEILGKHIIYTYENGWQYEYYFKSETEGHYRIHKGHVAGRWVTNRQYHMTNLGHGLIRVNWDEPVGNVVTMVVNMKDRWLHSYFLMPQWIIDNPGPTICHEDEFVEDMEKLREQGPTWPMHIAENTFAKITYVEDVGPNRDDIITCPPDELPAGYADRTN